MNFFSVRKDVKVVETATAGDAGMAIEVISRAQFMASLFGNQLAFDALTIAKRRIIRKAEQVTK